MSNWHLQDTRGSSSPASGKPIHNRQGPRSTARLPSNSRHRSMNRAPVQRERQGAECYVVRGTVEQWCPFQHWAPGPCQEQQKSLLWGRRLTHSSQGGPQSTATSPTPPPDPPARHPAHKRAQGGRLDSNTHFIHPPRGSKKTPTSRQKLSQKAVLQACSPWGLQSQKTISNL